jgi:hypothetical protein
MVAATVMGRSRFRVDASRFFNLPHPLQTKRNLRDPGISSRNLLLPLSVRVFWRLSSRAVSVEWLATAPAQTSRPPPSWIAAGRFAPPSLERKRPLDG